MKLSDRNFGAELLPVEACSMGDDLSECFIQLSEIVVLYQLDQCGLS